MDKSDFVHLHVHSDHSLLDGLAKVPALVEKAARSGQKAIALTDHGTVSGVVGFWKECKQQGLKAILGCEIYQSLGRMGEKQKGYHHLTVLAKDDVGWRNLSKITSLANLEGYYYRPRVDMETLLAHKEGLVVLSGCLKGPIPARLQQGEWDEARRLAGVYKEAWGDDFYLEVQPNSLEGQKVVNEGCARLARELAIKQVATCDLHYLEPADALAQEVRICISSGKTLQDENRLKMKDDFYFRDSEQMIAAFRDQPEAILATREIADKVTGYDLLPGKKNRYFLPVFKTPDGSSPQEWFEKTCREGLLRRYGPQPGKEVLERLEYEQGVIQKLGFVNYFLIVADFIGWARKHECAVGPGRGSAAGSVVAYCLGITDIDPLRYDLLFERFLNPERVSMPDIDVDFCETNRPRVIEYVRDTYGRDTVCQIVTFGTLKPKAAVKDVGRVLGLPYAEVDRISKLIPEGPKLKNLEQAFAEAPELAALRHDPRYEQLFDLALRVEGINRHAGKHAAGVVIADKDLIERIPLTKVKDDKTTQFTMSEVEEVGLLKMDFLGLRTLTLIEDTLKLIARSRGRDAVPDMDHLPLDDGKTYELLSRGDTAGVFQLESSGFRKLLKEARPDRFEDIVALIALYRPGPLGSGMDQQYINRKHGREPITYLTPLLEPILGTSYGCILYQEQVMLIANRIAGFSMAEADALRKAMGKKLVELMDKYKAPFLAGFAAKGVSEEIAQEVWSQIAFFAEYGFNRCLAASSEICDALTGERTTIGELRDHPRSFTVHALDDGWRLRPRRVVDVIANGKKPVFELRTRQGKRIVATGNHPFRVLEGWKNLEELRPGDRIAAPRRLSVPARRSWARHELITLGGLLSEGNLCHPTCLYFYGKERAALEDFQAAAEQFPGTVARIRERRPGNFEVCVSSGERGHEVPWNRGATGGVATLPRTRRRSGAFLWAERLGILGYRATEKHVPEEVFTLRDEDLELFLGRLWAGDGFIANAQQAIPFYATSSPRLARDVQQLLLRLGINSGVHEKRFKYRGGQRVGYTVSLVGEGAVEAFAERVLPHCVGREGAALALRDYLGRTSRGCTSKDTLPAQVREWVDAARTRAGLTWRELEESSGVCAKELYGNGSARKRGFRRTTIAELGKYLDSPRLRDLADSDVFWDEVVAIEPRGEEETFDLTVEHDHNFVADGLIVHNSHSAAYGLVTYRTAYLKAHFPLEFMAATLTSWMGDTDRLLEFKAECDRMKIEVVPPDVNRSDVTFSVEDGKVIYGLAAIRGIGDGAAQEIVKTRERLPARRFRSLFHLTSEVEARHLPKATLETLVRAGAFDAMGLPRRPLFEVVEQAMQMGLQEQKDRLCRQQSLFGGGGGGGKGGDLEAVERELLPKLPEWKDAELLAHEKQALGFYLTRHPLDRHKELLERYTRTPLLEVQSLPEGAEVTVGGMVSSLRTILDKKNNTMAFVVLEDFTGSCEAVVFGSTYPEIKAHLREENAVFVQGKVSRRREPASIQVDKMFGLEQAEGALGVKVEAELVLEDTTQDTVRRFREVLLAHQGSDPVYFSFRRKSDQALAGPFRVSSSFRVRGSEALREQLIGVLGPSASVCLRPR